MKIAFIGLGVMGSPMASNLVRADGYEVHLFDIDSAKIVPLVADGGVAADSADQAVAGADIVMTSLPGPKQINDLMFGQQLLESFEAGSIWIDLSTNNLETCQRIAEATQRRQIDFLDCPVSGGDEGARAGSLAIMAGGSKAVFERCLPVLEIIGQDIRFLGNNGAGYSAKIAQVILCYLHSLALSEALMLGIKGGVDHAEMLSIIRNSTGRSYVADRYGPPILAGDFDPSFSLGLAHKDMRLAMEMADNLGITLPMCDLTTQTYARAVEQYGYDANHLKAVQLLEQDNQVSLQSDNQSNNRQSVNRVEP